MKEGHPWLPENAVFIDGIFEALERLPSNIASIVRMPSADMAIVLATSAVSKAIGLDESYWDGFAYTLLMTYNPYRMISSIYRVGYAISRIPKILESE